MIKTLVILSTILVFSSPVFGEYDKKIVLKKDFDLLAGLPDKLAQWGHGDQNKTYDKKTLIEDMGKNYYYISLYFQSKKEEFRLLRVKKIIVQHINDRLLLELSAQQKVIPQEETIKSRRQAINTWADKFLASNLSVTDKEILTFYLENPAKFTAPATKTKKASIVPLNKRLKEESRVYLMRQKTGVLIEKTLKNYKSEQGLKILFKETVKTKLK